MSRMKQLFAKSHHPRGFPVTIAGWQLSLTLLAIVFGLCSDLQGAEQFTFRPYPDNPLTIDVEGKVLLTASDGGVLLLADDGQLWTVQPERVVTRSKDDKPFRPITRKEAGRRLLQEFSSGFRLHQTAHYVICHNTNDEYAAWVGGLFERAYTGFYAYWRNKGRKLAEPEFPLVAIVFADQRGFAEYARPQVGDLVDEMIGYYKVPTNRMVTYVVPNRERRVATLVHEAIHQLCYNSGLHTRLADNPYWVVEGMAIYFETTDSSAKGWRNIGGVNQVNLARFEAFLANRPADSLTTLIRDDERFRKLATAEAAYAESWALNYFLLRTKQKDYLKYLDTLSAGPLLAEPDPRARVQALQDALGMDLETLDREFLLYMNKHVRR